MATFQDHVQKAKKLTPDVVSRTLFDFIKSIEKEILDKNKEQLFEDSQDIYGNAIGFYSRATEIMSGGRKKAGEPFDAYDTGDFFDGFYMQRVGDVLRFGSSDPKTNDILSSDNWLSSDLFGLTEENLTEVIQTKLLPFIQNAIFRKQLDL